MIKITKPLLQKALIAGFFSAFTIGVLTVLTYKSTLGYFIAASFGSSMVLLFGFPESPFANGLSGKPNNKTIEEPKEAAIKYPSVLL